MEFFIYTALAVASVTHSAVLYFIIRSGRRMDRAIKVVGLDASAADDHAGYVEFNLNRLAAFVMLTNRGRTAPRPRDSADAAADDRPTQDIGSIGYRQERRRHG